MWMMGYNDGIELNNMADTFNGRKLRPLIPKSPTNHPPALSRIHAADHFLAFNHHLATVAEQSKRELNTQQQVVVSSRWNPTPEQLHTLEELYRRGTRTPSAEQIQHITAQLRRYGKIEGKNVFYWFQNHKARERQKRRRQLESVNSDHEYYPFELDNTDQKKDPDTGGGGNRTGHEGEETKSWVHLTNCSTHTDQRAVTVQIRAAKAAVPPECRTDGWIPFDERELQQQQNRRSLVERNATWHMMPLSSSSPPTHLINTNTIATTTTTTTTATTSTIPVTTTMDTDLLKTTRDMNIFISPSYRAHQLNHIVTNGHDYFTSRREESQTLELFPLSSGNGAENGSEKEAEMSVAAMNNANFTPYQFFEFLPLKN